jgi:hypothetical protein
MADSPAAPATTAIRAHLGRCVVTEEQVAEEVVDGSLPDTQPTDEEPERSRPEPAPQCAGCHRRGIELTLLENGKRYCARCAAEVERLMGIGPLFPSDADRELFAAHQHADEPATAEAEQSPAAELPEHPSEPEPGPDAESDPDPDASIPQTATEETAASEAEPAPVVVTAEASPEQSAEAPPELSPAEHAPAPAAGSISMEETWQAISSQNEAAAASSSVNHPRPTVVPTTRQTAPPTATAAPPPSEPTPIASVAGEGSHGGIELTRGTTHSRAEESDVMERVAEHTRPRTQLEPSAGPEPVIDLTAALAAERARLLEQRVALEHRFHADIASIDERLSHVRSLLGENAHAMAS